MIDFKPVAIKGRLGLGQPMPPAPVGTPGTVGPGSVAPASTSSRKTIPLILTGATTLLSAAAAYGNSDRDTEGKKTMFMLTAAAAVISAGAFLFFIFAPE